ncbi:hypothetical protein [Myroides odoratus]|uniref:hypothetical protein n=1 Tax=Myroides odoratus TaxID=256 RepID=UPI00333FADBC
MIKPIQHDAVNWVDGMKISKKHFDAQTNFILDGLRDVRATYTQVFSYGLLPLDTQNQGMDIVEVRATVSGDVEYIIKTCKAITPSGCSVEVIDFRFALKPLIPLVGDELEHQKRAYYVVIAINLFDKIPYGTMDVEETPPRYPFTKPRYRIDLRPVSAFDVNSGYSGGDYVIIGQVMIQGEMIQMEEDYIPPCTSVSSHPLLLKQYNKVANALSLLQKYAVKILQKEHQVRQNTKLASSVKLLCQALIHDIGATYFHFRNTVPHLPPLYFMECLSQIATHLHQVTQTLAPMDLEELLNYISEWSEIVPHTFLNQLARVAEIKYQHTDCASHLSDIQLMLSCLEKVFFKLNELDYIGQRKENIIVNELEVTPAAKTNRGWSVLD